MNFYKHFLGDYARDTAHLSLMEHGAYRTLLDTYYATEAPLPADNSALYRIAKAIEPAERKAVDSVIEQFFHKGEDGKYHNTRADAEVEKAKAFAEKNKEKGKLGGRPKKPDDKPKGKPGENPLGYLMGSDKQTRGDSQTEPINNPNHSHSNTNQSQNQNLPAKAGPPDGGTLWDFGVGILADQGIKAQSARVFLGSLLRDWEEPQVEAAIRSAVGKADAKGYILGVLKGQPRKGMPVEKRVAI